MNSKRPDRPPEAEARMVISVMMLLTVIIAAVVLMIAGLSTSIKSIILITWIGVMMAVLRRYRLE